MWNNNVTGSLISNFELNNLNNVFFQFFNTFARTITVFKESTQVPIQSNSSNSSFGFGSQQTTPIYSYSQVTQTFPALITYPNEQNQDLIEDANIKTTPGQTFIKVQANAMNFIENGKTTKISIDGRDFELISEKKQKTLLNSVLYEYTLQSIDA